MKKWILIILALMTAVAGYAVYHIQTQYAGIGLPWTTRITLPELPVYDNVKRELSAVDSGELFFESKSPYDFSVLLKDYANAPDSTGMGTLTLPDNASADAPVPAMIILHGSGGMNPERELEYARMFNELGIAAFVLDYYTPRGVTEAHTYLQKTLTASETDIVVDAYAALKLISTHPFIDGARIGVTGYSYGGMATRYTLDARVKQILAPDHPGFALHADFYGPCHQTLGSDKTTQKPYLAVFGDEDNSVDPAACEVVHQALEDSGSIVETFLIPGAGHAWENAIERKEYDFPFITGCEFSFQPETGLSMINGKLVDAAPAGADREVRAFKRAMVMVDAPECIGRGYIMGNDPKTDALAKQTLTTFLQTHFFQKVTQQQ